MTLPRYNQWTPVDASAAAQLTCLTNSPGLVYPVGTSAMPEPLKKMADASSFYVSGYTSTLPVQHGFTAVGEAVVARVDSFLTKHDNYLFATNSAGQLFVNGPYKGFGHHVTPGNTVEVSSLFHHNPVAQKYSL